MCAVVCEWFEEERARAVLWAPTSRSRGIGLGKECTEVLEVEKEERDRRKKPGAGRAQQKNRRLREGAIRAKNA